MNRIFEGLPSAPLVVSPASRRVCEELILAEELLPELDLVRASWADTDVILSNHMSFVTDLYERTWALQWDADTAETAADYFSLGSTLTYFALSHGRPNGLPKSDEAITQIAVCDFGKTEDPDRQWHSALKKDEQLRKLLEDLALSCEGLTAEECTKLMLSGAGLMSQVLNTHVWALN